MSDQRLRKRLNIEIAVLAVTGVVLFLLTLGMYWVMYTAEAPFVALAAPAVLLFLSIICGNGAFHRFRLRSGCRLLTTLANDLTIEDASLKMAHWYERRGEIIVPFRSKKAKLYFQMRYDPARTEGSNVYFVLPELAPIILFNENRTLISDSELLDMTVLEKDMMKGVKWVYTRYLGPDHYFYVEPEQDMMDKGGMVLVLEMLKLISSKVKATKPKQMRWPRKLDDGVLHWFVPPSRGAAHWPSMFEKKGHSKEALPLSNHRRYYGNDITWGAMLILFALPLLLASAINAMGWLNWMIFIPTGVVALMLVTAFNVTRHVGLPNELKASAVEKAKLVEK